MSEKLNLSGVTLQSLVVVSDDNEKIMLMCIQALININKCLQANSDGKYGDYIYRLNKELTNKYLKLLKENNDSDEFRKVEYEYTNYKNLEELHKIGIESSFKFMSEYYVVIDYRGYYKTVNTLQYIINNYFSLSPETISKLQTLRSYKENLSKEDKEYLRDNDLLYNFLKKVQRAIKFVYPYKKLPDGSKQFLNNNRMNKNISGFLTIVYNTLKQINPLGNE
ncbi:MAG TPA: hypothetical protein PKD00_01510 [Burkholderiales bacterium]|nr:hypothetical protein [Burkholderiales bacterium]